MVAVVVVVVSGESSCTCSRTAAARALLPSARVDHQPQRGDGQVARVAYGGEAGHVVPFDRALHRRLQGRHAPCRADPHDAVILDAKDHHPARLQCARPALETP
jgi:hypothetical protein